MIITFSLDLKVNPIDLTMQIASTVRNFVKGSEYLAVVEYAPYQKIPHYHKKDPEVATILNEKIYQKFVTNLQNKKETERNKQNDFNIELKLKENPKEMLTPLLKYVNERKKSQKRNNKNSKKSIRRKMFYKRN